MFQHNTPDCNHALGALMFLLTCPVCHFQSVLIFDSGIDLRYFWSTKNCLVKRFTLCSCQWPLSKLSAASALRAGRRSLALWDWAVRSWRATQRSTTSLRFRTPTSSWPRLCVTPCTSWLNKHNKYEGRAKIRIRTKIWSFTWFDHVVYLFFLGKMGQHD